MSDTAIVDPTFLDFFRAGHQSEADVLKREVDLYEELLTYGWTVEQLILAAKTGYDYSAHSRSRQHGRSQWKPYTNANALTFWLNHWYQSTKAETAGMTFDEFVKRWCGFSYNGDDKKRGYDDTSSLNRMKLYVRARRYELSHEEAHSLVATAAFFRQGNTYIDLRRRGLGAKLVQLLVWRYEWIFEKTRVPMSAKYVTEAFRRGATDVQLLSAIKDKTVRELALNLRRESCATD